MTISEYGCILISEVKGSTQRKEQKMNKYEIRVNGAIIKSEAGNEYTAIKKTGIVEDLEMIEAVRTFENITSNVGWIYTGSVNNKPVIVYVKRI